MVLYLSLNLAVEYNWLGIKAYFYILIIANSFLNS